MLYKELLGVVFVSGLWGFTNPLMRHGLKSLQYRPNIETNSYMKRFAIKLLETALHWKFLLPFSLNLCASVLFVALLANQPITFVVPIVNALTFLFTTIFGSMIGEKIISERLLLGSSLIIIGIIISTASK